jgi:hypothetical protein
MKGPIYNMHHSRQKEERGEKNTTQILEATMRSISPSPYKERGTAALSTSSSPSPFSQSP